jgi:hypothetical protein
MPSSSRIPIFVLVTGLVLLAAILWWAQWSTGSGPELPGGPPGGSAIPSGADSPQPIAGAGRGRGRESDPASERARFAPAGLYGTVANQQGKAIEGTAVIAWASGAKVAAATTDSAGRFQIERTPAAPDTVSLTAHHPAYRDYRGSDAVLWGVEQPPIVLGPRPPVEIHVTRADTGAPVEHFDVWISWKTAAGQGHKIPCPCPDPVGLHVADSELIEAAGQIRFDRPGGHAGGVVRIDGVESGRKHHFFIAAEDPRLARSPLQTFRIESGAPSIQRVVLQPLVQRIVEVVDEHGHPVQDAIVELLAPVAVWPMDLASVARRATELGELSSPDHLADTAHRQKILYPYSEAELLLTRATDRWGTAWLSAYPADTDAGLAVRVWGPVTPHIEVDFVLAPGLPPLRIETSRGATVHGHVELTPAHREYAAAAASHFPPLPAKVTRSGWMLVFTARGPAPYPVHPPIPYQWIHIAADGSFRCERIPPGNWRVEVVPLPHGEPIGPDAVGPETKAPDIQATIRGLVFGEQRRITLRAAEARAR